MDDTVIAVIPAYKPQETMLPLCRALREAGMPVVVVDDGGGEGYRALFEAVQAMGCTLARHAVNLGKGRALKTGMNEALMRYPNLIGVVTADADGQHTVKDILRVREALLAHPSALTIGARAFCWRRSLPLALWQRRHARGLPLCGGPAVHGHANRPSRYSRAGTPGAFASAGRTLRI